MTSGSAPVWRARLRRQWPHVKFVGGLGLGAVAVWVLTGRRGELAGASGYLDHLRWGWIILGAAAEGGSLVAFAMVQRNLLRAGGVTLGPGPITAVTLVSITITNSIPAGPVMAALFTFRQFRRRGADDVLAAWVIMATFVFAGVSLALVAGIGAAVAGAEGANLDLIGVIVTVLIGAVLMGVLFVQHRALIWLVSAAFRLCHRVSGWPRGDLAARIDAVISRLTAIRLSVGQALGVTAWGLANWFLDCSCLGMAFRAVGVGIPWKGLLLAYGGAQLAVNLPVTPGGLGVVEGTLTIALVAYGGAETSTVAAVLLYRILSFWGELPFGWITWAALAVGERRHRRLAVSPVPSSPFGDAGGSEEVCA